MAHCRIHTHEPRTPVPSGTPWARAAGRRARGRAWRRRPRGTARAALAGSCGVGGGSLAPAAHAGGVVRATHAAVVAAAVALPLRAAAAAPPCRRRFALRAFRRLIWGKLILAATRIGDQDWSTNPGRDQSWPANPGRPILASEGRPFLIWGKLILAATRIGDQDWSTRIYPQIRSL